VCQQGLLHLPRADVEPATNDDVLDPPGDPQVSVLVEPADITSAPPAFIVGGLRGEIRPAPVLEQSPRTAVPDLAGRTDRGRPAVLTDDPDLDAGNRPAVGAATRSTGSSGRQTVAIMTSLEPYALTTRQPPNVFVASSTKAAGMGAPAVSQNSFP
jgi:hypothetical protein